jgi:multicomponent Na+:H+ antiporter subunit B
MSGDPDDQGMGEIVQTSARWLRGFILTYGIYVILYGHVTPGGGFAGGVVIACGFILLTLAGGETLGLSHFSRRAASTFDRRRPDSRC